MGLEWSRDCRRHMTPKGQVVTNILRARHLNYSWRCYSATIAN